ncbi:MAG: hypothetical protein NC191_10385, partial [Muribaculaceae bacterium]|nr:hypothetical protein [Muribaculaceae bacterium]
MEYLILSIGILLVGGLLALVAKEESKLKICSVFTFISSVIALIPALIVLINGTTLEAALNFSSVFGAVRFVIDPLSAVFIAVISIMSFLGTVYANGYMQPYLKKDMHTSSHCFFFMLLIASMLGVVTVQN